MNTKWLYVLFGGLIEVVWVAGLKHAHLPWQWAITCICIAICFYLVVQASKHLPVGTVYAVFVGLGTAGTVLCEMLFFKEPFHFTKIVLIALLLSGVMGLKMITDRSEKAGE